MLMDFRKVENIFITVFLLLNIYLLFSYFGRSDLQSASTNSTESLDVVSELNGLGVELPELTDEPAHAYVMQANNYQVDEDELMELEEQSGSITQDLSSYTGVLDTSISLEGTPEEGFTESDFETIEEFLNSEQVLFGEVYEYQYFDPTISALIYAQEANGIPIDDGTSQISFLVDQSGNVTAYTQTYTGEIFPQGEELELISDLEAIEVLFQNNEFASNMTVMQPRLVYYRSLNLEELSVYTPSWKVTINSSEGETEEFYVDATNGQIVTEPILGEEATMDNGEQGQVAGEEISSNLEDSENNEE